MVVIVNGIIFEKREVTGCGDLLKNLQLESQA